MCVLLWWHETGNPALKKAIGELGLTLVHTLEPSLENAYECLLKE